MGAIRDAIMKDDVLVQIGTEPADDYAGEFVAGFQGAIWYRWRRI